MFPFSAEGEKNARKKQTRIDFRAETGQINRSKRVRNVKRTNTHGPRRNAKVANRCSRKYRTKIYRFESSVRVRVIKITNNIR